MNKNLIIGIEEFNSPIDIKSCTVELAENINEDTIKPPITKDLSFQFIFKLPKVRILELEYKLKKKMRWFFNHLILIYFSYLYYCQVPKF